MELLFRPYLRGGETPPLRGFDILMEDGDVFYSLVHPGESCRLDPALVIRAFSGKESVSRAGTLRRFYRPVNFGGGRSSYMDRALVEVTVDYAPLRNFALLSLFISLAACAAAGLLSLATARSFFDHSVLERVEALQTAMDKVAGGERGVSFETGGDDEIAAIGMGIETMLEEVRSTEEDLRNARMAEAVGLMAGGLAHDINNLLTGAVGAASLLRSRLDEEGNVPPDEIRSSLKLIESTGEKGGILVRDLLALARADRQVRSVMDLRPLLEGTIGLLKASTPASVNVELTLPGEPALVLGASEDLERTILNLCRNGVQAMTDMRSAEERRGGKLSVELARTEEGWSIAVADDGVGIPPEVMRKLFTPFFSTKSRRSGSGLGLSASRAIAEAHGGRIAVAQRPEGGSVFTLVLPAASAT